PAHGHDTACGHEHAAGHGQSDGFDADIYANGGGNESPHAIFEGLEDLRQFIRVSQKDERDLSKFGGQPPDFIPYLRIADPSAAKIEQDCANGRHLIASGCIVLDPADRQHLQSHTPCDQALGEAFAFEGAAVDDDERTVELIQFVSHTGGLIAGIMYAMW